MSKKSIADVLDMIQEGTAFKSDDKQSEVPNPDVLDKDGADTDLPDLEDDGKSKAGKTAEEKNKSHEADVKVPTKLKEEDKKSDDDSDEKDDDEDDEDDLEENTKSVNSYKLTSEDFDASDDLAAIFGADDSLTESFKGKVQNIYEASVIAKANEVIAKVYADLTEAYDVESKSLVDELQEAYQVKVTELEESIDKYLDKVITEWRADNAVQIASVAKFEIAESFMSKLKNLLEEHYIDLPDDKVSVYEELQNKYSNLEEKLNTEINRNIELTQKIKEANRAKIVEGLAEGLSDVQKDKFIALSEGVSDDEKLVEKLTDIKTTYFKTKNIVESVTNEDSPIVITEDTKTSSDIAFEVQSAVDSVTRFLGKK